MEGKSDIATDITRLLSDKDSEKWGFVVWRGKR
jgi:hypothetical protein